MDRLTSLTAFARVVDCGGFSAAARRLNMSVTMVSNHVQALEDRLGARLLNRTTRKVGLTEIGKAYYERCVQILGELEEADRIAQAAQATPTGTLRLYTAASLVRFLAPVIGEYLSRYPGASIDLTTGERMVDLVEEGIDLAIRAAPAPESSLIVRKISGWRGVVCCSPAYLESYPPPLHPKELATHNCLRYAFYPFGDEWRFIGPDGAPVAVTVSGNLVTTSSEALRLLALSGHGVFLAPGFVVADDLAAGHLVRLLDDYPVVEFAISAFYPHRHNLSSKVRSFIDLAADRFADHLSRMEHSA